MSIIIKKSICVLRSPCVRSQRQFSNLSGFESERLAKQRQPITGNISAFYASRKPYWHHEHAIHHARLQYSLAVRAFSRSSAHFIDTENEAAVSGQDSPGTIAQCVSMLTKTFTIHGVTEEESSAMYIVAHALGHKTLHNVKQKQLVSDEEWQRMREMALVRCSYSPIQYVLGEWDFCDLTLHMKPPVYIPRPETEILIGHVLKDPVVQSAKKFLEIGTGSGAISLALLNSLPDVKCTAVEPFPAAYQLTKVNADKYKLRHRLELYLLPVGTEEFNSRMSSWTKDGKFEFIVSNPPYVPSEDIASLSPEVASFEDRCAIDGGWDGLDVIRSILKVAPRLLREGGSLWLEVDEHHPEEIRHLVDKEQAYPGLEYVQSYDDHNELCHNDIENFSATDVTLTETPASA